MAHVSNTTVNKTRQKTTKSAIEDDQKNKPLSVSSQAFKLFMEYKSIVQVAIGLDLPTEQVLKINYDYLVLRKWDRTRVV
jgi:hypothetical protein